MPLERPSFWPIVQTQCPCVALGHKKKESQEDALTLKKLALGAALAVLAAAAGSAVMAQPEAPKVPKYIPQPDVFVPPATRPEMHTFFIERTKPTGTTPRRADGKPDLSGFWNLNFPSPVPEQPGRRANEYFEPDQSALQRSSHYYKPYYKPEYWKKVEALDFSIIDTDPAYGCDAEGVPRQGIPQKILQADKEIWLYDGGEVRIIPIGTKTLTDEDADESTNKGISAARWDGDVLVIDSVGFNGDTWLAWEGLFHTDRMKVQERLWRDGNLLYYNFTVDDPDVLLRPWTSATQVKRMNPNNQTPTEGLPCLSANPRLIVDQYYRG